MQTRHPLGTASLPGFPACGTGPTSIEELELSSARYMQWVTARSYADLNDVIALHASAADAPVQMRCEMSSTCCLRLCNAVQYGQTQHFDEALCD